MDIELRVRTRISIKDVSWPLCWVRLSVARNAWSEQSCVRRTRDDEVQANLGSIQPLPVLY